MKISNILAQGYDLFTRYAFLLTMFATMFGTLAVYGQVTVSGSSTVGTGGSTVGQGGITNVQNTITTICTTVKSVIFILGLVLMILGAALYASAHVLPAQTKGTVTGYGMGMIMGGIVGVIIAVAAPYILQQIANNGTLPQGSC
ncbi:MAG: hypothetical protein KGH98_00890 [Candidatus Micrarchaeota archaeon]|nr:hypothetical protein [Candidatus Micrarchaeota archaeon]